MNNLKQLTTQNLKALLALRGDVAEDLSKELQSVLDEVEAIRDEISLREGINDSSN